MDKKINLNDIILKHINFDDSLDSFKDAMLEFGKQLLELAAEKALVEETCGEKTIRSDYSFFDNYDGIIAVNKQSILNTIKQIE